MTPAARAARLALSAHDLDHAESDVYERVAEAVRYPAVGFGGAEAFVAYLLDREGLALEGAPETQAAAVAVAAAVRAVTT